MAAPSFSLVDIARRGGGTFEWFDLEGRERTFRLPSEDALQGGLLVDALDIRAELAAVDTNDEAQALIGRLRAIVAVILRMADPGQVDHMLPLSYAMLGSVVALAAGGGETDTVEDVVREAVDVGGDTDGPVGKAGQEGPPTGPQPAKAKPSGSRSPKRSRARSTA